MRRLVNPQRWKEALKGVVRLVTEVEYSNDGGREWTPAQVASGPTVTCDSTQKVRWSCDMTLIGVPYGVGGINQFTTRIRIRHGIQYRPGDTEMLDMGVYRVVSTSRADRSQIQVTGDSFESYLIAPWGRFPRARRFETTSAQAMIRELITEVLPRASISWRGIDGGQRVPTLRTSGDRWALIDGRTEDPSIARALGARVHTGGGGEWIVEPPGSLADRPVWSSKIGETQVEAVEELTIDGFHNAVSVKGEQTDGSPTIGPIVIADTDPHSLTNVERSPDDGGSGLSLRQYSSSKITTVIQATRAGQSMLAQDLGLKQTIQFTRVYDPSIEAGDVGRVDTPAGERLIILDTVSYDLSGGAMSGSGRTTSSRYAGRISEFTDPDAIGGIE